MINICGLWKHQSKNGETFYSGMLGNVSVMIFANKNKKSDKAPDFNLCIAEKKNDYQKPQTTPRVEENPWK